LRKGEQADGILIEGGKPTPFGVARKPLRAQRSLFPLPPTFRPFRQPLEFIMLKWALIFLVISLVAGFFGFSGVSAATAKIAKILFVIAIVIFLLFVVLAIMAGQAIL
jgi:uncharacterized membrane protein YtjA (UPF0391 family)